MERMKTILTIGKGKTGFTFLELLIVLLVVGLLTAASVPAFKTFSENMRLRAGARLTLNLLRQARADAMTHHRTTCLVIAPGSSGWPDLDLKAMKIVYLEAVLEDGMEVYITLSNWEYLPKGLQINSGSSILNGNPANTITIPYPNEDGTPKGVGAAKFKSSGIASASRTIRIETTDDTSKYKEITYLTSGRARIK